MKRILLLAALLPFTLMLPAQTASKLAVAPPAAIQALITEALAGDWTGVLEYRDYSEPETSTKRVQLPTWLSIRSAADGLSFHYIYDDGPRKTVEDTDTMRLDVAAATFSITNVKHRTETYTVEGYDTLHAGRGTLLLVGPSTDNGRPVETHITITIGRNLLLWNEENRPTATTPFAFRHRYTFTRALPPALAVTH